MCTGFTLSAPALPREASVMLWFGRGLFLIYSLIFTEDNLTNSVGFADFCLFSSFLFFFNFTLTLTEFLGTEDVKVARTSVVRTTLVNVHMKVSQGPTEVLSR